MLKIELVAPDACELLTEAEAARILSVSRWTLSYWRKRRQGPPFVKVSRRILRYPRAAFVTWLHAHLQGGARQEAEQEPAEELLDKLKLLQ